jgi:quercetin dioxygenase-like cupin family protein
MKTSLMMLASSALLATLVGGMPSTAKASDFKPLGEGALSSGNYVEDFQFTLFPGESVPWHYHPGRVYAVIAGGTITEEHGCGQPVAQYSVGSAFTERPGVIHRVFNYGTEPVVLIITFIVPPAYKDYTGLNIFVNGPRCEDNGDD